MRARGGAAVGILGGDLGGLFLVRAAHRLGLRAAVLDPNPAAPAHHEADVAIAAECDDREALDLLAGHCVGVAVQLEAVPAASLETLARTRFTSPAPEAPAIAQDRLRSRRRLRPPGLATALFAEVLAAGYTLPAH